MNHAKKVEATPAGYPVGAKPLKSYSLKKLRRGQKITGLEDPAQSDFDPRSPAAQAFEERIMGLADPPSPPPTLLEDFATDVMPSIARVVTGFRAHGYAVHIVVKNAALFTLASAGTIFATFRSFAVKVVAERL